VKYLGITIDKRLDWKAHIQEVCRKALTTIPALKSLAGSTWGARLQELRKIYQMVLVPQILYGCSIWGNCDLYAKGIHSQNARLLNSIQTQALRVVTGAYKATSQAALNIESHTTPILLEIKKRTMATAIRARSAIDFHIWTARAHILQYKKSPMAIIQRELQNRTTQLQIRRQEIILPYLTTPWWTPPKIRIPGTAQEAIKAHNKDISTTTSLAIYTDGSGISGKIGAAAIAPE